MDVFEAIANRRSIRAYKNEPVPAESLERILEAARVAPTAANRQEFKFVVVTDEGMRKALASACNNQTFVGDAGVVIAACAINPERRFHAVDVAIAVDHMTLAAHALGLGTCWIGAFSEEKVKELLGIPEGVKVVCVLPVGVPAKEGVMRSRKAKEDLFVSDKWQ
ncbi:MAG: nitroreductase family protein [Bacillota bacterium]|jgi:nitroreductase